MLRRKSFSDEPLNVFQIISRTLIFLWFVSTVIVVIYLEYKFIFDFNWDSFGSILLSILYCVGVAIAGYLLTTMYALLLALAIIILLYLISFIPGCGKLREELNNKPWI